MSRNRLIDESKQIARLPLSAEIKVIEHALPFQFTAPRHKSCG
jgi:hypothetical protein